MALVHLYLPQFYSYSRLFLAEGDLIYMNRNLDIIREFIVPIKICMNNVSMFIVR